MNDSLFGIHATALELRSRRMGILTANIANASTPGYKARDLDFAAALSKRQQGMSQDTAIADSLRYRVPVMPSADGNTVELGEEQLAFAQNAIAYSASLSFLQGKADTLKRALKGE